MMHNGTVHEWIDWLKSRRSSERRARYADQRRQQLQQHELARLDGLPRYQPAVTELTGDRVELVDGPSHGLDLQLHVFGVRE